MSGYCGASSRTVPAEYVGVPTETLQMWLTSAQNALNQLESGTNPNSVSYAAGDGSKSVTFQMANAEILRKRIRDLAYILGLTGRRRALRPGF